MPVRTLILALLAILIAPPASASSEGYQKIDGFIDLFWEEEAGRLLMKVDDFESDLIYQTSLARGLGSNDIGLDRGQLGATRLVRFERHGNKVLLVQPNMSYRASGDNAAEKLAVEESFADSVIWGFTIESSEGDAVLVDATRFFLRDAHGVGNRLSGMGEGSYSADASRSAIYLPRTKGFPDNTEIEAIVTFTGKPTGRYLRTVAPDAESFSLHLHHSFIRLPEPGYEPLPYDPRSGVIGLDYGSSGYTDYASTIGEPLKINYGVRHRLEKKDPTAETSEAVEPIVYYLDPGAPEPVRSALLEGARWWNQAFEAAGYKDAFQVRMLPDGADPMDVRYNIIQWVHRSTRGWSYGASVRDPRTGEILKGHVTLGSLRVRQDYLIAEGLLAPYSGDAVPPEMLEMSLARIRQLSAHEIGHTIGFVHNFAASTQDRSSVMDYPFPLVKFGEDGELDLSDAYDDKIGGWDIRTVLYAYQDFPDGTDVQAARDALLAETIASGYRFVSDSDSRSVGSAHPHGNLWDNGADAIEEMNHLLRVREHALSRFDEAVIRDGRAMASIEETLVPIYLLHRFQLHAVGKLIGGLEYGYTLRGDGQAPPAPVDDARQRAALATLLATLDEDLLRLPPGLAAQIPPRPPGNPRTRETFRGSTGVAFDPLSPAAASTSLSLQVLLHPVRAARLARQDGLDFAELVDTLLEQTWYSGAGSAIARQTAQMTLTGVMQLAFSRSAEDSVRATALDAVMRLDRWLDRKRPANATQRAHFRLARHRIASAMDDPASVEALPSVQPPPGSPIG